MPSARGGGVSRDTPEMTVERQRAQTALELLDWKRRIFELYARVRSDGNPEKAWDEWRRTRDEMFASHPQSPIPESDRGSFHGLPYWPYDPSARVLGQVEPAGGRHYDVSTSGEAAYGFEHVATAWFVLHGREHSLELLWLDGYGGGLLLAYRDASSGRESYGAGRYLLDTVKGSDLGMVDGRIVLDFNFSYNPSCSYDPKWVCPLATPANRLSVAVEAGEKTPAGAG